MVPMAVGREKVEHRSENGWNDFLRLFDFHGHCAVFGGDDSDQSAIVFWNEQCAGGERGVGLIGSGVVVVGEGRGGGGKTSGRKRKNLTCLRQAGAERAEGRRARKRQTGQEAVAG